MPYGTAAEQATQDNALEASFLRIITIPAIPRLSLNDKPHHHCVTNEWSQAAI